MRGPPIERTRHGQDQSRRLGFQGWADRGYTSALIPDVQGEKRPSIKGWKEHLTVAADLKAWETEQRNVALRTDAYPTIDIDVDKPEVASAVRFIAEGILGAKPITRTRPDSNKLSLTYALDPFSEPIQSQTFTITLLDFTYKVEIKGTGSKMTMEGLHPDGAEYELDHVPKVTDLPLINQELIDQFEDVLANHVKNHLHGTFSTRRRGNGIDRTPVEPLDDDQARELLGQISDLPNPIEVDREEWIGVAHAVHNLVGEEGRQWFIEWTSKYPGRQLFGEADHVWDSLGRSYNGLPELIAFARRHGARTIANKLARVEAANIFPEVEGTKAHLIGEMRKNIDSTENRHSAKSVPHRGEGKADLSDEATEQLLDELAGLSKIEYDRRREEAAEQLDVRLPTLDDEVAKRRPSASDKFNDFFADIDPWPEPVDGAELLDEIIRTFDTYIVMQEGCSLTAALWTLHAHAHDAAQISPNLTFESPQKRCGKTNALSIVQQLTPRPLLASNTSSAAIFRGIEKYKLTLLLDEAETYLKDDEVMCGILNGGHYRNGSYVMRVVGDDHDVQLLSTWAPKAMALIGRLPDTLQDRSIVVELRRKKPTERVQRLRLDRVEHFQDLRRKAARWTADNISALRDADPVMPASLHDRAADNWRPLLAIADQIGGKYPEAARKAAEILSGVTEGDGETQAEVLLADLQEIFREAAVDWLPTQEIIKRLVEMEDRPWATWRRGNPATGHSISRLLKSYHIKSTRRRDGGGPVRGYQKDQFRDAWERYLPPLDPDFGFRSGTIGTALKNKGNAVF